MTFVCAVNYHFVPVSDLLHIHSVDDRSGVNDSEQADNCKASSKDRGASCGFCFDFPRQHRQGLRCVIVCIICLSALPRQQINCPPGGPTSKHQRHQKLTENEAVRART